MAPMCPVKGGAGTAGLRMLGWVGGGGGGRVSSMLCLDIQSCKYTTWEDIKNKQTEQKTAP